MKWISIRKQKPPLDTQVLIFQHSKYGTDIRIAEYVEIPNKLLPKFGSHVKREKDGTVITTFPVDISLMIILNDLTKFVDHYQKCLFR